MSLERSRGKRAYHLQMAEKSKIKPYEESKNEMNLSKIISLDTASSVRAKLLLTTSKHQIMYIIYDMTYDIGCK